MALPIYDTIVVASRVKSAPTPVWPDAPADLGTAGASGVALRLRLQNLGPREEGRSEQNLRNHLCGGKPGSSEETNGSSEPPLNSLRAGSGSEFAVWRAGEAYDAR